MIDLHTHTIFSDGELIPSELVRRAHVIGYTAIAITDHVDSSNIDFILPRIVKVSKVLNSCWDIKVIPGVEITHAPLEEIPRLVKFARKNGAKVVVVHGETYSEPVLPGTNRAAIESGADILAHPGYIKEEDARLAAVKGVHLELTARAAHRKPNKHVLNTAKKSGARLVLNTDTHESSDLLSDRAGDRFLASLGIDKAYIEGIYKNSRALLGSIK